MKIKQKLRGLLELYVKSPLSLGLSLNPYPLFQWYPQSKNFKGLRLTIIVLQVGAVKIYVAAAAEALTEKEIPDETQFGSPLFRFVKFSFPVTRLMRYYVETGSSCPLIAGLYR
jgi:hypothetical protein